MTSAEKSSAATAPRYKDMTPEQRLSAWTAQREAVIVHQDAFASRPYRYGKADNDAWRHMQSVEREAAFILRVARSCGDAWARA